MTKPYRPQTFLTMTESSGRRCVFCNNAAGSREHALPDWLARAMDLQDEPAQPGLITALKGIEPQGNPRATGKLITKEVCGVCNNGWMAELEGRIVPLLGPLVTPGFDEFTREALQPLEENLTLLMHWLMKTAVTLSRVAPRGELGALPDVAAGWALNNTVPSSCRIYAGWIETPGFSKTIGRGLRILNGGQFHGNLIHQESFNFCIQLNHLGLRFVNAPEATWGLTRCINSAGETCSPRILGGNGYFLGTENDSILFRDFFEFSKVCVLATGSLPESLDPEEELKMAQSIRRLIP